MQPPPPHRSMPVHRNMQVNEGDAAPLATDSFSRARHHSHVSTYHLWKPSPFSSNIIAMGSARRQPFQNSPCQRASSSLMDAPPPTYKQHARHHHPPSASRSGDQPPFSHTPAAPPPPRPTHTFRGVASITPQDPIHKIQYSSSCSPPPFPVLLYLTSAFLPPKARSTIRFPARCEGEPYSTMGRSNIPPVAAYPCERPPITSGVTPLQPGTIRGSSDGTLDGG